MRFKKTKQRLKFQRKNETFNYLPFSLFLVSPQLKFYRNYK
eukprot:UN24147